MKDFWNPWNDYHVDKNLAILSLLCSDFLDSVFEYLASISHRAKPMAKIVYIFSVIQSTNPEPPPCVNLTHQTSIPPASNQPRTRCQITGDSSCALKSLGIIQIASPKLFTLPCLIFPEKTLIKTVLDQGEWWNELRGWDWHIYTIDIIFK